MGQSFEDTQTQFEEFRTKHERNISDGNIVDYLIINNYLAVAAK
jgi:hypothetical protein